MNRTRITVSLWPKGRMFEGKRTSPDDKFKCLNPTLLNLEIADCELLIAEWKRTPHLFEQEGARSLEAALREWQEEVYAEDEATGITTTGKETPDYGNSKE